MGLPANLKVKETMYEGAPLYLVPELRSMECEGCCFDAEAQANENYCKHSANFNCSSNATICVRSIDDHIVFLATNKLTGESP